MFLATTALTEFWDKDQDILALGAGCLLYDKRSEWETLNYRVMPSVWDDRRRFYEASRYVEACYEQVLERLAGYLNSVHQVSHGRRYWRIILGPWLFDHLSFVYDRYVQLGEALRSYPDLETLTLDAGSFRTPEHMWQYCAFIINDAYNLQVASQLLTAMGYSFPSRPLTTETWEFDSPTRRGLKQAAKNAGKWGLRICEEAVIRGSGRIRRVALCDMNLPRIQSWAIARHARLRATPFVVGPDWKFPIPGPTFDERRNGLSELASIEEFQRLFFRILPVNFPSLYLEGFKQAEAESKKTYPKPPPVIASVTGWYYNEPFKFFAARASENGSRLLAAQHGGFYGTSRFSPSELHESSLSDSYLVWGWGEGNGHSHRNLPSPKLSANAGKVKNGFSSRKDGPIVLVTTTHTRFTMRLESHPIGGLWPTYLDWQLRFVAASPEALRRRLLIRPFQLEYGWAIRNRIADTFPDLRWDDGVTFETRLRQSPVVVIDNPGTTFLEAMAANVPTVLFWDPDRWEMRPEAEPYFDTLRTAGILWDSPEAAAAKTACIMDHPIKWWGSDEVQEARRSFADRFALATEDWAWQWAQALRQEAACSQAKER